MKKNTLLHSDLWLCWEGKKKKKKSFKGLFSCVPSYLSVANQRNRCEAQEFVGSTN